MVNSYGLNKINRKYNSFKKININESDKIVIMSDLHRGGGDLSDSLISNRYILIRALKYYYSNEFTVIEAGDGEELWKNRDCIDISNSYEEVYNLYYKFFKRNNLYLIYGNHDKDKYNRKYIYKQINKINRIDRNIGVDFKRLYKRIKVNEGIRLVGNDKNEFLVIHGHQADIFNCELMYLSRFLVRYFWKPIQANFGIKEATSPADNLRKSSIVDRKLMEWAKENKIMLICGHTHNTYFSKPKSSMYFNCGCATKNNSITAIEIRNNKIYLVEWFIDTDENMKLCINRKVINGPKNICDYFKR